MKPNNGFSIGDKIALVGVIVAILGIVVTAIVTIAPIEIRCMIGLQQNPCPDEPPKDIPKRQTPFCPPFLSPGESCDT